jgi:quinol monooxygenase YgiN
MHMRIVTFQSLPDHQDAARAVAAEFVPALRKEPGCLSAHCFHDATDGQGGLAVLWETSEQADAAHPKMRPKLEALLKGHTTTPPAVRLFPVLA